MSCGSSYTYNPTNPNPSKFEFVKIEQIGNHVVAMIRYPNCTNYEGKKVLVFLHRKISWLQRRKEIDPHFVEDGSGPDARFAPTEDGYNQAKMFAGMVQ